MRDRIDFLLHSTEDGTVTMGTRQQRIPMLVEQSLYSGILINLSGSCFPWHLV